jgi:uncharacterized Tic20 family protein
MSMTPSADSQITSPGAAPRRRFWPAVLLSLGGAVALSPELFWIYFILQPREVLYARGADGESGAMALSKVTALLAFTAPFASMVLVGWALAKRRRAGDARDASLAREHLWTTLALIVAFVLTLGGVVFAVVSRSPVAERGLLRPLMFGTLILLSVLASVVQAAFALRGLLRLRRSES